MAVVTCAERNAWWAENGATATVGSGRTDLDGQWGDPCIETTWLASNGERLTDVRHPAVGMDGPDRAPCEHRLATRQEPSGDR